MTGFFIGLLIGFIIGLAAIPLWKKFVVKQ